MALRHVCDCGEDKLCAEADLEPLGILGKQYCQECLPLMYEYLQKRDELQEACAGMWEDGLAELKKKIGFSGSYPDEC